ncbi:hypothetical protein MTO96_046314 [Rhipicephalus appendiculatus]
MFPGPARGASKAGAFVTLLAFFDIYAKHESLKNGSKFEYLIERGMVGGYTVQLDCRLEKFFQDQEIYFGLTLCDGSWNQYLQWPFSKNITLIITHLRNSDKDIRLPMIGRRHVFFRMPAPGVCSGITFSRKLIWEDIELNGFIVNKTLFVNIEFE